MLEDAASKSFAKLIDKIHKQHVQVTEILTEDARNQRVTEYGSMSSSHWKNPTLVYEIEKQASTLSHILQKHKITIGVHPTA